MLLVYFKLFLLISITCISATPARSKRQKHGHNRVKVEGCDSKEIPKFLIKITDFYVLFNNKRCC